MDEGANGTTITNAPGVTFGLSDWGFTGYEDQIPQYPTFITFYMDNSWDPDDEANIEVKDFTAHWSAGTTEKWALEFDGLRRDQLGAFFWVPGRLTGTKDPTEVSLVTTEFHNLELTAESALTPPQSRFGNTSVPSDAISVFNLVTDLLPDTNGDGIQAYEWQDIKAIIGNQEISNVHIENIRFPIFITGVDDSEVVVNKLTVNNPSPRNTAVIFCDSGNSAFTVTNLEVSNALGAALVQGHWRQTSKQAPITMRPSSYDISHSTISSPPNAPAIVLVDRVNGKPTGYPTVLASITKNTITTSGGPGAIFTPPFAGGDVVVVDDALVSKNTFLGTAAAAIHAFNGNDWVIHKNDVSGFTPFVADIFLQPGTSGFSVLGNDPTDTVLDLGTNNTIANANGIPKNALAKEAEEKLEERLEEKFWSYPASSEDSDELDKTIAEATDERSLPEDFKLLQNYPNPFNPETEIRFQLPEASNVLLKILNILGQEIRTLVDSPHEAGYHNVRWDGRDISGNVVSSGIYFYYLQAGNFSVVKKMSLLR